MNEFVINVAQDSSTTINVGVDETTLIQAGIGLPLHSVSHISGGNDELNHNLLTELQGGAANQYYHLSSGQYFNLTTGSVVRPSETGVFYPASNPSGYITGINNLVYATGDQTISGIKTFTSRPTLNGTGFLLSGEAAQLPETIIYSTGNQDISGIKNFLTQPTISGNPIATISDPVGTTLIGNGVASGFAISGASGLINPSALIVAIDGALQEPTVDYSVSAGVITFIPALANGAKAVVISPTNVLQIAQMIPSDGSVTSAKIATGVTLTNPIINGTLTVGGQTQLTGQAATDASSAMTRGLGDARYFLHSTNFITVSQTKANNADFAGATTLTTIPRITCAFLPSSIRVRACIMFTTAPVAITTANFDFILYTTNIGTSNMSSGTPLTIVPTSVTKVSGLEQYIIIAEVSAANISTKYGSAFSTFGVLNFLNGCDLKNKTGTSLTTVATNAGFIALEIYR